MNFQQNHLSNCFNHLYPRDYSLLGGGRFQLNLDSTEVNRTNNNISLSDRRSSPSGLRKMRRILNSNNEQTAHSLVDVVRDKNFQTQHTNRVYTSRLASHSFADENQSKNEGSSEVNGLVNPDTEYGISSCMMANGFNSKIQNADTDYSYFIEPTETFSDTRTKSNEYSLFSDSSSSRSTHSSNSSYANNDYTQGSSLSSLNLDSNMSGNNNLMACQSQTNKHIDVMNSILGMSKPQLEQLTKMIHGVIQRQMCLPVADESERLVARSPLPTLQNEQAQSWGVWNGEESSQDLTGTSVNRILNPTIADFDVLQLQAQYHRTAAARGNSESAFTWNAVLPKLLYEAPFSRKIFVGGLPYQMTEDQLISAFNTFGNLVVDWPQKEKNERFKGYAYIIFENEFQVKFLLKSCRECEGNLYYTLLLRNSKSKEVQIIPWSIADTFYCQPANTFTKLEASMTVYVGALHGTMNAKGLFSITNDLFGGVIYAGICVDKYKYPTGSGRVVFNNYKSYVKAVTSGFVNVKTPKFMKTIQLDPFLDNSPCSICTFQVGPYFCRKDGCFRYFCSSCWKAYHKALRLPHVPLMKNSKLCLSANSTTNSSSSSHFSHW